jgi:UDP-3-O-[3-hydroxymyristoyl] N-acetylglucosamine deacetylase
MKLRSAVPSATHLQTTLRRRVALAGRGAHSDQFCRMTLAPAGAGAGVVFIRVDCTAEKAQSISAHWTHVTSTQLRTQIGFGDASISTIEHVMAALSGLGIDNAIIELDGPEVPALDGSARVLAAAISDVGIAQLKVRKKRLRVLQPVRVVDGASWAEVAPWDGEGLQLDVEIAFSSDTVGRQRFCFELSKDSFLREIAPARSFGFVHDAERLWREGLALGASLENSVVLDGQRVLNPEGLRYADECVRHKALDLIGDLALAGAPIIGAVRSYRGGHSLNLALVEKFMTTPGAVEIEAAGPLAEARAAERRPSP